MVFLKFLCNFAQIAQLRGFRLELSGYFLSPVGKDFLHVNVYLREIKHKKSFDKNGNENPCYFILYVNFNLLNFVSFPKKLKWGMTQIKNMNYTTRTWNGASSIEMEQLVRFLYENLDEYGDTRSAIRKAIEYAAKERSGLGGYIFTVENNGEIAGAVVVNKTGMDEYIPENILVYIAVHQSHRGKGLGKMLMEYTLENCKGDIALHVEADNPAKHLYEKFGFKNPYLEMRLKR